MIIAMKKFALLGACLGLIAPVFADDQWAEIQASEEAFLGCMKIPFNSIGKCGDQLAAFQIVFKRKFDEMVMGIKNAKGEGELSKKKADAQAFFSRFANAEAEYNRNRPADPDSDVRTPFSVLWGPLMVNALYSKEKVFSTIEAKSKELKAAERPAEISPKVSSVFSPKIVETKKKEEGLNQSSSEDPVEYQEVGRDYIEGGSSADAERVLTKSLELKKDDPEALSLRSLARSQSGNMEGALVDAQAALERDPSNKLAGDVAAFAKASLRKHSFKEVRKPGLESGFGAGAEGAPRLAAGPAAAEVLGADRAGLVSPQATETPPAGGFAGFVAPAPRPERPAVPAPGGGSRGLLDRSRRKLEMGDERGALLDVTRAIDLDRSDPAAWVLRARISNRLNNPAAALADADEALKLAPGNAGAYREKAYALYELGRYEEALPAAERAVSLDPSNGAGYLYRAMILEKLNRIPEALKDYETAARLDPALRPLAEEAVRRLGGGRRGAAQGPSDAAVRYGVRGFAALVSLALMLFGARVLWERVTRAPPPASESPAERPGTLPAGAVLGGNFRVERELGRGGMGVVYEATDLTLKRRVALKQVRVLGEQSPEGVLGEARLVAQLKHPNLVPIFSVVDEGGLYLVFELLEGETLDKILGREGRLSLEETRRILSGACAALEYAHSRRIIHRDIKPANVILTKQGEVKVTDFGLAHESKTASKATRVEAWGTPRYMAPEQMFGEVSKASDVYALGVMTYELLTGEVPFPGADLDAKTKGRFRPASEARGDLPGSLDDFFRTTLAPRPEDRPPDAAEFLAAFDRALS